MDKAIICDIDGVLLDTAFIFDKIEEDNLQGAEKWEYFNCHANDYSVFSDTRIMKMLELYAHNGYKIFFLTARSEEIFTETREKILFEQRLCGCKPFDFLLIMRPFKVSAPADEVKYSALSALKKAYNISFAIDDDLANCEMYAKHGILSLQVRKRGLL